MEQFFNKLNISIDDGSLRYVRRSVGTVVGIKQRNDRALRWLLNRFNCGHGIYL